MKSLIVSFFFLVFIITASAQDCAGYYYLYNSEVQITIYDKNGKESGKQIYTINAVTKTGGIITANFVLQVTDDKGKSISKGEGMYKCNGASLFTEARAGIPQEQMTTYKDMDVVATDPSLEYPPVMSAGQSLKNASFKMNVYNKDSVYSSITLDQANRKVEGKQTITSPTGVWDCWKITYDGNLKKSTINSSVTEVPADFKIIEWFAPGFGTVKTETYKSGALVESTLVTSVKK